MAKYYPTTIHTNSRIGLLFLLTLLSFSCRHENAPSDTNVVTFYVDALSIDRDSTITQSRMQSSSPTDITLSQANMTDLWVFEGSTLLAHQTATDPDFGAPSISLSYGSHSITFVASNQSGQSFTSGTWHADKANDCFGSVESVNVSTSTSAQSVILMRCSYGLKWQSTDLVPASVRTLRLSVSPMYESLTDGLHATDGYTRTYTYDVSSYIGRVVGVTVYGLPAEFGVENNITTTIDFLDASSSVLFTHTTTVPVISNRRTIITAPLFNSSSNSAIRINSNWLTDYETSL